VNRTVVLNVVGLTPQLLGKYTPHLSGFAADNAVLSVRPAFPAVTCTAQATYLTGKTPSQHGIVGNGWYFRDECEIKFWRQSNQLVQAPKIWEIAQSLDSSFTCANLFWWYNMYSSVDFGVTPRPMYLADGRKVPDIYTKPSELRSQLQQELGRFPLFEFWGPKSSIASSRWIAEAAKFVERRYRPTLTLVYLPHLDYCLQKFGPDVEAIATELQLLDTVCGDLLDIYKGCQVIVLSEYGIGAVSRPIYLNRIFRERNAIAVREELGRELLDAGASRAFAVADHQIAHIYVRDRCDIPIVRSWVEASAGVETVLDEAGKKAWGLDHPRSGDLVAIAAPDAWFAYYYWLEDDRAPDFARTVDIHRKPGYDPVELFLDPNLKFPELKIGFKLLQKQLGLRTLMDVIPLDAELVRGSHGRIGASIAESPLAIGPLSEWVKEKSLSATDVYNYILNSLFSSPAIS
jgi:predicted AlkP superfamily pyrophosphatase or phosphodiesterase